ncbi:MAG TPA: HDIG domain-containing protein [Deltaproteobacteria bacterium]|nr:HDIG domain-containing protein [Deltaproteobacteria bacterium]
MKTGTSKDIVNSFLGSSNGIKWGMLTAVTVIFTLILSPNLVMIQRSYKLGDVAERDIKASKDFLVEDRAATEESRRRASDAVLTVYDHDIALDSKMGLQIGEAFKELQAVIKPSEKPQEKKLSETSVEKASEPGASEADLQKQIWEKKKVFEEKIGITISKDEYSLLIKENFSNSISDLINKILAEILINGVVANKEILLREADKGIVLRKIDTKTETVAKGLKKFYGLDQAKTMVRVVGQPLVKDLNHSLRDLIVDLCQKLIQPNVTLNRNETEERRKNAAEKINPTLHKIKAGEMLLREGEIVTEVQLLKLKMLQSKSRKEQLLASSIGAAMIILCLMLTTYALCSDPNRLHPAYDNKNLLFITCVFITFLFIAKFSVSLSGSWNPQSPFSISAPSFSFGIPLASGTMVVCLFIGLRFAILFAMIMAISAALLFQNRLDIFIYFFISSSMAAYWLQSCRERKVFIKAGLKLGLLNVILATAIDIYLTDFMGLKLFWDWGFAFIGGIVAGILTAGIAPLVEIAFGYTTDITLLELANLDRPILRRLMIEAPGTYHHSVIVGSMVEAAASEMGANSLLAKVCGYYHDIGKIRKPLYFIENQTGGKNKHDKLAPSMSSLILISHVKDGVEIAKEHKLGQTIIHTIRQHHGTSLIRYFFEKAKQQKGETAVDIDNFRYPGPKPQTREAGLVMLADVIEAASRTLDNPTPSRIQGLVQNLTNQIFTDGQLEECELTLKDLNNIAKSFNTILNGIHHHRIEYSESAVAGRGKTRNGSTDRQQTRHLQDVSEENREKGTGRLKRLGLS